MSGSARAFWQAYLATLPQDSPERDLPYLAEPFGDSPEMADRLGALVLGGAKTATCSALREYGDEPLPEVGDLFVVLGGRGEPLCVARTTEVEVRRFEEVDEAFALAEGEGDRTLASWREAHERFFSRTLSPANREFSPRMPLGCERFRVVYRGPESAGRARRR